MKIISTYYLSVLLFVSISSNGQITTNSQWTWVKGSNESTQVGVYGTKGVPNIANTPGARDFLMEWKDPAGKFWIFGGSGHDRNGNWGKFNDLWKYDPITNEWTWMSGDSTLNEVGIYGTKGVTNSLNKPGGRFLSQSWIDNTGNLWLFGGLGNNYNTNSNASGYLNDLWKYDPVINQWTWMHGSDSFNVSATYGIQGVSSITNCPGGKWEATSWTDLNGNFWVIGGYGVYQINGGFRMSDLWKYDPLINQWTWVNGDSSYTTPYGVYGTQGVPSITNKPGSRQSAISWTDAYGDLIMFGGKGYNETVEDYLNDLWKYNIATNQWVWIGGTKLVDVNGIYGTRGVPHISNMPGSRLWSYKWKDESGNLWLLGGAGYAETGNLGDLNDLWKYDPLTNEWTWMNGDKTLQQYGIYGTQGMPDITNKPGARGGGASWVDDYNNFWFWGGAGWAETTTGWLNDMWRLDSNSVIRAIADAGPDKIICSGLSAQIGTLGNSNSVYSWTSNPAGFISSIANPLVTPLVTTSYYLKVTRANSIAYDTVVITVNNLPIANAGIDKMICPGNNTTIGISAIGEIYSWVSNPPGFISAIANPSVNPANTTSYYLMVTSVAGCIAKDTVIVNVSNIPTANAGSDKTICSGNSANIGIAASGDNYSWTSNPVGFISTISNPSISPTVTTYYYLTVTNGNGCVANDTVIVTVSNLIVNAGADKNICSGVPTSIGSGVPVNGITYSWTSSTVGFTASGLNITVAPIMNTSYYLTATNSNCVARDTVIVAVLLLPKANAGKDTAICPGGAQAFLQGTATNLSGQCYYSWGPLVNINFISADSSRAVVKPLSKQEYIFTVKDNYGCNFSVNDTMTVFVQSPFNAFAGNDTNALYNKPHQLMASGGNTYSWTPASALNNPFIPNPLAVLQTDTYFTVTITDTAGCSQTDDVFIKVYKGPTYFIPNAFSPNGDGLNDIFRPVPVGITTTLYFRIFNRYGEMVFETNKWLAGWDGNYKGIKVPSGEYVWILKGKDVNGFEIEMKGNVLLVR